MFSQLSTIWTQSYRCSIMAIQSQSIIIGQLEGADSYEGAKQPHRCTLTEGLLQRITTDTSLEPRQELSGWSRTPFRTAELDSQPQRCSSNTVAHILQPFQAQRRSLIISVVEASEQTVTEQTYLFHQSKVFSTLVFAASSPGHSNQAMMLL